MYRCFTPGTLKNQGVFSVRARVLYPDSLVSSSFSFSGSGHYHALASGHAHLEHKPLVAEGCPSWTFKCERARIAATVTLCDRKRRQMGMNYASLCISEIPAGEVVSTPGAAFVSFVTPEVSRNNLSCSAPYNLNSVAAP